MLISVDQLIIDVTVRNGDKDAIGVSPSYVVYGFVVENAEGAEQVPVKNVSDALSRLAGVEVPMRKVIFSFIVT